MNTIPRLAFLVITLVASATTQAADVWRLAGVSTTGNVGFTTDYRLRGVSQSSNNPAIQGAISFNHESGAYASLWGSSISARSSAELDAMLGYASKVNLLPNLDTRLDAGYIRYIFAGSGNEAPGYYQPDFNELFVRLVAEEALATNDQLELGLHYSNDYLQHSSHFWHLNLSYRAPLSDSGFGVLASLGYNNFSSADMLNRAVQATGRDEHYLDYKLGTGFAVQGLNAELAWVGNNLKTSDCVDKKTCKSTLQLSITKSF